MAREGYLIEVRCILCSHTSRLDPRPFAEKFGEETYLIEDSPLYSVLRCSQCGSKTMSLAGVKGSQKKTGQKISEESRPTGSQAPQGTPPR